MKMNYPPLTRSVFTLVVASICGALAGAAAGFLSSTYFPEMMSANQLVSTSTTAIPKVPTSTFALVPLERRPAVPLLPPAFAKRRVSAVASLYRKPKGVTLEERLLGSDRLLGQAVALTSDGWFVTSASAIEGMRLADVTLWHNGKSYVIEHGVIDRLNSTAFLKTNASDLSTSAFAHVEDLQSGAELWSERRSGELEPAIVLSTTARTGTDTVSSETASRRIIASGLSAAGDRGGALWDPNGSLVGLIDSPVGERVRLIPASGIASSFTSLLNHGEIRHAQLGVRALDLADLRLDGLRDSLPESGALIRDEKKTGKLGVTRDLAAFKANLKVGDVILRVDRDILDGSADLGEVLADYQPGTTVTLRVLRGAVDSDIRVVLGKVVTSEPLK